MVKIKDLSKMKSNKQKISMITAYDYFSAKLIEEAGIDTILVGDSVGMAFKGEDTTLNVTLDEIIYHTKVVRRGARNTFIIADMPFMSFHLSVIESQRNAARLMIEGGANAVKLEGGSPKRLEMIRGIIDCEIPVVGHLGLTPQSIHKLGKFRVQGKEEEDSITLLEQAKEVEKAGAFMLVLEAVPESLGREVSNSIDIPVIGIGAGRFTDGQVLVINDLLGLSDYQAKFSKIFVDLRKHMLDGLCEYQQDVKKGTFPGKKQVYYPIDDTE